MLDFIANMNEWQFYPFIVVCFLALGLMSKGAASVKWTREKATSGAVNLIFLKTSVLYSGLFFMAVIGLQKWYGAQGFPQLSREFWDSVPMPLAALALLFVYDFTLYWVHRFLHTSWLWPSHAVHHSDTDMNFLTWSRGHPVEQMVIAGALVLSSTWLGLEMSEIAGLALMRSLHQYYVHANLDWDHGPLHYVLASPRYHRWHHVDHPEAYDKNFASIFPFLDKMFGTYYNPHSAFDMPTGIGEHTPRHNLIALITWPFMEWARMIGEKLPSAKETPDIPVATAPNES